MVVPITRDGSVALEERTRGSSALPYIVGIAAGAGAIYLLERLLGRHQSRQYRPPQEPHLISRDLHHAPGSLEMDLYVPAPVR